MSRCTTYLVQWLSWLFTTHERKKESSNQTQPSIKSQNQHYVYVNCCIISKNYVSPTLNHIQTAVQLYLRMRTRYENCCIGAVCVQTSNGQVQRLRCMIDTSLAQLCNDMIHTCMWCHVTRNAAHMASETCGMTSHVCWVTSHLS